MTYGAVLLNGLMFPHERPSLLRMALIAELVHTVCLDLRRTRGAMGLVAV
jgi:hypothetical protein